MRPGGGDSEDFAGGIVLMAGNNAMQELHEQLYQAKQVVKGIKDVGGEPPGDIVFIPGGQRSLLIGGNSPDMVIGYL